MPDIAAHRTTGQPFDAPGAGEWSLPALGLGAIATAFLEPDPAFTWDTARAAALRDALTAPDLSKQAKPPRIQSNGLNPTGLPAMTRATEGGRALPAG